MPTTCSANADLAMYRAKATGAGGFERYHPRLHVAVVEGLQLEAELRQALAMNELELHYQPTLSLPRARPRASRRSRAGSTRAAASSHPPSSSRSQSRPA